MDNIRQHQITETTRLDVQRLIAVKSGEIGAQTDSAKPIATTGYAQFEVGVINVNRDAHTSKNIVTQTRGASEQTNS